MKVTRVVWESVKISSPDSFEEDSLTDCSIHFSEAHKSLRIDSLNKSILLARASLVSMTPWSMEFTASKWSAPFDGPAVFTPVKVTINL